MEQLIYKEEAYQIIGICMEAHRILGKGQSEVLCKDALEYKFQNDGIESQTESHLKQTLNYLAASELNLGLLVNFGQDSLVHKRIIL